jgi:hypothetical protein
VPVPHVADAAPEPGAAAPPRDRMVVVSRHPRGRAPLALVALLVAGLLLPGVARAEEPTPAAAAESPSASPVASPTPEPTPAATPDPTPVATPDPTPTPVAAPTPLPTPAPDPTPVAAPIAAPDPTPVVISRSLYRSGAAATQFTGYWCVPASVQTMANLILGTRDTSFATQKLIASVTYRFNRFRYSDLGNDIRGWAGALNWRLPDSLPIVYRDRSYPSRTAALNAIVDAIDETGYPVGITVWHGGHAWSVVGYKIRQVGSNRSTREILGFYAVGPLGSPRDPFPVRYVALDGFLGDYTRYYDDKERAPWHKDYVLVRPERITAGSIDWPRP